MSNLPANFAWLAAAIDTAYGPDNPWLSQVHHAGQARELLR